MTRERLIQLVSIVVLAVAWYFLKDRYPLLTHGIWYWSDRASPGVVRGVGITSAALLALALGLLIWERLGRLRHAHSYIAQMERWFSNLFIAIILIVGAGLALGMLLHSRLTVMIIGGFTIFLALWLLGGLIAEGVKSWRKKRAMRESQM